MTPKQIEQINRGIALKIGWEFVPSHDAQGKAVPDRWIDPEGYEHFEDVPFKSFATDERTRPQILAALSEDEKDKLVELHVKAQIDSNGGGSGHIPLITELIKKALTLTQSDLCKLFCAVKNIEVDL